MPITQSSKPEDDLSQGDILRGLKLFETVVGPTETVSKEIKSDLCLVLSRPCVGVHKDRIVVAVIEKANHSLPNEVKSLNDANDFFRDVRDGTESPDCFYLGDLPDLNGRFVARLDMLHTVEVSKERNRLKSLRIAKLVGDFSKDLHLRLFQSFASLGFDDVEWYSTEDLKVLKMYADQELAALRSQVAQISLDLGKQTFSGHNSSQKKLQDAQILLAAAELAMKPYLDELTRRNITQIS